MMINQMESERTNDKKQKKGSPIGWKESGVVRGIGTNGKERMLLGLREFL